MENHYLGRRTRRKKRKSWQNLKCVKKTRLNVGVHAMHDQLGV